MSNDYQQQVSELSAQLPRLQANFTKLQTDYHTDQLKAQADLSIKTTNAMQSLQDLVVLLHGEFNPSSPPAGLPAAVTNLNTTWLAAEKASEHYLDLVNSFSVAVVQYHDGDLGGWQAKANTLDTRLDKELQATRTALSTAQNTVYQLNRQREDAQSSLSTLRDKLHVQKHKYDEADKYTWIWPPARLVLEILKPIIEALTDDVATAERAVSVAEQQASAAEQRVRDENARINTLSNLSSTQTTILALSKQLIRQCVSLQGSVESMQKDVARIKTQRYNAWQLTTKCANRAENAEYALTKADYGTTVLQIAEVALQDPALCVQVANIVDDLARHDDSKRSIASIKTDEHPNGLLAFVENITKHITPMSALLAGGPPLARGLYLSGASITTGFFAASTAANFSAVPTAADFPGASTVGDLSDEDRQKIMNLLHIF
ncbi:hypothetical protein F4859DRAFT_524013 [Xylaria cf. heliscus]|nr:hypothetical protein F4859DRAFT_524013 [Xylaria cf. heliscus]